MNCQTFANVLDERGASLLELDASDETRRALDAHATTCSDCAAALVATASLAEDTIPLLPTGVALGAFRRPSLGKEKVTASAARRRRIGARRGTAMLVALGLGGAVLASAAWWSRLEPDAPRETTATSASRAEPGVTAHGERQSTLAEASFAADSPGQIEAESLAHAVDGAAATQERLALDRYTVAVIPFKILSDDPRASEVARAVYDAVIDGLSSIGGIHVANSSLVLPYAGSGFSPAEVARALGAGNVVYGEVFIHDEQWRADYVYGEVREGKAYGGDGGHRLGPIASGDSGGLPDADLVRALGAQLAESIEGQLFPDRRPDPEQVIAEMQAKILNAGLSDWERVHAAQDLPYVHYVPRFGDQNLARENASHMERRSQAFGGSVAAALVHIATHSDDANLRQRIWSTLRGVNDPNLVTPLLFSLQNDANDAVRREAALRLIESFHDVHHVQEALQYAAENDPSESVRFALLPEAELARELRATILDTNASYRDRSSALRGYRFSRAFRDLDDEIVVAMVDMARSGETPRARYGVWMSLLSSDNPYIVEPMIKELEETSSDDMKTFGIEALSRFLDYPGVREALEQLATHDPSLKIRAIAREALDGDSR